MMVSCSPEEDSMEQNKYNVLVRHKTKEVMAGKPIQKYIGTVKGLSACQYHGNKYRKSKNLEFNEWDIVCCWFTNTSKCKEEHIP